jgi:hypothetical protein
MVRYRGRRRSIVFRRLRWTVQGASHASLAAQWDVDSIRQKNEPHQKDQDAAEIFKETYRVIVLRLSSQASPRDESGGYVPPNRDHPGQLFIAFTNQLNATGRDLVNDFRSYVSKIGGCLVELNALHNDAPLGWSLSQKSRNRLKAWLDGPESASWKSLYSDDNDEGNARLLSLAKKVNG